MRAASRDCRTELPDTLSEGLWGTSARDMMHTMTLVTRRQLREHRARLGRELPLGRFHSVTPP